MTQELDDRDEFDWYVQMEIEHERERAEAEANSPPLNTFGDDETPDWW